MISVAATCHAQSRGDNHMQYFSSSMMKNRNQVGSFSRSTATMVRAGLAAACLIGLLALTLSRASAQDRAALRVACEADYRRVCASVRPGGGRILACLNDNLASLSEPCKQVVAGRNTKDR
jgi:hypothetical protein